MTDFLPIHFSGPIRQGMIEAQRARHARLFNPQPKVSRPVVQRRIEPVPPQPVALAHETVPAAPIPAWPDYLEPAPYDHCEPTSRPSARDIIDEVCKLHGVTYAAITGGSHAHRIVVARREAYYRLREERQLTWQQVGNLLGGRDHTSAMHGYRRHADALWMQAELAREAIVE